jgi:hypothetical protein
MENKEIGHYNIHTTKDELIKNLRRFDKIGLVCGEHYLCYKIKDKDQYVVLQFRRQGKNEYSTYHKASTAINTIIDISHHLGAAFGFIKAKKDNDLDDYTKLFIQDPTKTKKAELINSL